MSRFARRLPQPSLDIVATAGPPGRPVWHASGSRGPWPRFANASLAAGSALPFVDVGCAQTDGELHVCATREDGSVWHTIRHMDGSWQPFGDVSSAAQSPGPINALDCAALNGELHVCAVDAAGGLFHAIRHPNSWNPFANVKRMVEHDPGEFSDVACAGIGDELHVCAITPESGVWHTIRWGDGSWEQSFTDLRDVAGDPGAPYRVGCASVSYGVDPVVHVLEVVVVADRDGSGLGVHLAQRSRVRFANWHPPEQWTRFEGLRELDAVGSYYDVACARVEDDVHVLVYDGKANGIRHAQGIWSGPWLLEFIDTQSLGLRPGSVACTRAAPVSGRMWGAGAVGALMARARFLYPRRAGERRLNGSVTTPVASRRTISSTSRFTGYAAEAHGSSTSDRRSSL